MSEEYPKCGFEIDSINTEFIETSETQHTKINVDFLTVVVTAAILGPSIIIASSDFVFMIFFLLAFFVTYR